MAYMDVLFVEKSEIRKNIAKNINDTIKGWKAGGMLFP